MEMKHSDGNFTDYFTGLIGKGNTQKTDTLQVITLSKDLATNKNLDYTHIHSHHPQHQLTSAKEPLKIMRINRVLKVLAVWPESCSVY